MLGTKGCKCIVQDNCMKIKIYLIISILIVASIIISGTIYNNSRNRKLLSNSHYGSFSQEEIAYGRSVLYPVASSPENSMNVYFKALENGDRRTVLLLSSPSTPPYEGWNWIKEFDVFWNEFAKKPVSNLSLKNSPTGGYFAEAKIKNSVYHFQINRVSKDNIIFGKEYFDFTIPPDLGPWSSRDEGSMYKN
jgi:hypothetical protein